MYTPSWLCADGRRLRPDEMTDLHLQVCINKILRSRSGWRSYWLPRLLLEQEIRKLRNQSS